MNWFDQWRRDAAEEPTYIITAHYPKTPATLAKKVTTHTDLNGVGEAVEQALRSGASFCSAEPEWASAKKVVVA